jgi:hypothetical protein
VADIALAGLALGCIWAGPRLIEGFSARQWVRYHAARGASAARPAEHLRGAARAAVRALDRVAPLPWGAEAARQALELARRLEPVQPKTALEAYAELATALSRARASRWRGLGLGELAEQAATLERAARARNTDGGP